MSDFVTSDTLHELWDEIIKRHWTYFDSEESIVKLKNRQKLEDCLKEFLCIVQHDRKFFLPETAKVLRKTIHDLDGFSAQKAITAFESISQYANNLFTKPWRKEFRILKMYSGFYQHEIKSNLLDAEILFEAMGYRRLSEDILILDGPICPDQVTNVSRDAMTAYVELQIIKLIYTGLDAIGLNCSWLEIYRYREKYTGGTTQAVKNLAYSIDEKRFRSRQKSLLGDNYGYIVQPSSKYFATNAHFCPAQCQCRIYQQVPSVSRHRLITQSDDICSAPEHHQQSRTATNLVYSNMAYPAHYQHNHHHSEEVPLPQMSHSRSLEHYSEPDRHQHNMFLHRHSFDHQQQGCTANHPYHHSQQLQQQRQYHQHLNQPQQNFYESPYDCIDGSSLGDGSSNISYAAVGRTTGSGTAVLGGGGDGGVGVNCNLNSSSTYSHSYNVSGNRFPLPLNISNQLSAYDNMSSNNYSGHQEPTYAHITDQHMYSSISKLPQNYMMNTTGYNQPSNFHDLKNTLLVKDCLERQRSCHSEQLINFEEPTILRPITPQHQFDPENQYRQNSDTSNHTVDKHYNINNVIEKSIPPPATSACQQHCVSGKHPPYDDVYAKPTPKENRKQNAVSLRKYPYNSGERGDTTDMSYESANDDFINHLSHESECNQQSSSTQFTNNQDGVGSNGHWSYVFQTQEKNGYSKDLNKRKDLLVQSLDFDALNINDVSSSQSSSTEKRKSENERKSTTHQHQQLERTQKSKSSENTKYLTKNNATVENSVCTTSTTNDIQKQKISMDNNTRKIKSALKQTNSTSNPNSSINLNHQPKKTHPKTNDNKTLNRTVNNNNIDTSINPGNGTSQRKTSSSSSKKSPSVVSANASPNSTEIIVTSANEWSCGACTFLNPGKKRICEICHRAKDFNLHSSTTSTATGGTTVTHNTPTCV